MTAANEVPVQERCLISERGCLIGESGGVARGGAEPVALIAAGENLAPLDLLPATCDLLRDDGAVHCEHVLIV